MTSRRPPSPRGGRAAGSSRPQSKSGAGRKPTSSSARRPARSPNRGGANRKGPSNRRETRRETGGVPAVERPGRAKPPKLFTMRAIVLFGVILFALVTLIPTLRAYLGQRSQIAQLEQEFEEAETREDDLRAELARWEDPAYVAAQARDRLSFVMPGETAYKVIDPDTVDEDAPDVPDEEDANSGVPELEDLVDVPKGQPWYTSVRDSLRVAGETEGGFDSTEDP